MTPRAEVRTGIAKRDDTFPPRPDDAAAEWVPDVELTVNGVDPSSDAETAFWVDLVSIWSRLRRDNTEADNLCVARYPVGHVVATL